MNSLIRGLNAHRWLIGLAVLYVAAVEVMGLWLGFPTRLDVYQPATLRFAYLVPVIYALARAGYLVVIEKPDRPLAQLWGEWLAWISAERIIGLLICLAVLLPFLSAFTSLKSMIPVLQPFAWDNALFHLDRAAHGGSDPWRILQPVVGHRPITTIVAAAYHSWYFVIYLTVMAVCWSSGRRRLRMQFLITFVLCWMLLGSLVAVLLSSAGPCYFGRVTGLADPYAPLMAYLNSVSAIARVPQESLWLTYQAGRVAARSGISAMPSMHVAMVTLVALLGWRVSRPAGLVTTLYAAIVMIGSVHLGWHYAVDGYASAAGTVVIWTVVGWLQRRGTAPAPAPLPIGAAALAAVLPGGGRADASLPPGASDQPAPGPG